MLSLPSVAHPGSCSKVLTHAWHLPLDTENQWHWTEVEATGRGKGVDPLEMRTADMQEELLIEVRSSQGVIAAGALSASELWKVPSPSPPFLFPLSWPL